MGKAAVRIGGALGLLAAFAVIPAYLVGTPDTPRRREEAVEYYEDGESFVTANGTLPLLHILLGLAFLGVLVALLRQAAGPTGAVYTTLAGGIVWFTLSAVGFAAEVAYPAAIIRFAPEVPMPSLSEQLLALSEWLYHYCQIGAAAMIFAASLVIWRTGVLPKWVAVGAILGVLPLAHRWLPLPAALSSLAWLGAISVIMLVAPGAAPSAGESRHAAAGMAD